LSSTSTMHGLSPLVSLFALVAAILSPVLADPGFEYGCDKVRGVNLGGWLVLEPWITPSLFDDTGDDRIIDEYTFGQYAVDAQSKLKKHWDTWITEADFIAIAEAGLNHVRLPIGYWAWDISQGEPFVQGQVDYLDKAVEWASKHNLKVIVDLHGAPGSQNGFDNSGQKMDRPTWQTQQINIDRTNAVIKKIASKFKDNSNVVPIIAPLNEPAGFYDDVLTKATQYWYDSFGNIRYPYGNDRKSDTIVLLHDAFKGLPYWSNFMTNTTEFNNVAFDTHIYQMFSNDEVSRSDQEHIDNACNHQGALSSFHLLAIVGEWTAAATDCAKYLNGRHAKSRYDGTKPGSTRVGDCSTKTGSGANFSSDYKTFLRKYWEAQVITYDQGDGWVSWTWKAEEADDWSYQAGLKYGWIPQDPADYKYPTICG